MQIDAHVHSDGSAKHIRGLLKACDKVGTDKAIVFNTNRSQEKPDEALMKGCKKHPDRLIPFARLILDDHTPADVERFKDMGFVGFKVIIVRKNYDDPSYFPLYEAAANAKMPILFHLGIVGRGGGFDVNSNRMRPIYLDTICRAFPKLHVQGAHLGNPWYEEASMSARWNANLWFDLSGSTLKKKTPEVIDSLFWWHRGNHPYKGHERKHPYSKILFATDVANDWIEDVHRDYVKFCDALDVPKKWRKAIFGGNAERMLFQKKDTTETL
jgi:uncharacterized protein